MSFDSESESRTWVELPEGYCELKRTTSDDTMFDSSSFPPMHTYQIVPNSKSASRTSAEFPVGHGELELITSDNTIFHFPSFLLMHVSPVFRDRINKIRPNSSFDGGSSAPGTSVAPLELQESSEVVEAILRLCDPCKKPPSYGQLALQAGLLEAGRKWKIAGVLQWWEKETVEVTSLHYNPPDPIKFSPEMALILASRFHSSPLPAQQALRILIIKPYTQLLEDMSSQPYPLHQPLFLHLLQLRQERARVICGKIAQRHNDMRKCTFCGWFGLALGHAIRELTLQVMECPSWKTVEKWSFGDCQCWTTNDRLNVHEWKDDILRLENDLPTLPEDWRDTSQVEKGSG